PGGITTSAGAVPAASAVVSFSAVPSEAPAIDVSSMAQPPRRCAKSVPSCCSAVYCSDPAAKPAKNSSFDRHVLSAAEGAPAPPVVPAGEHAASHVPPAPTAPALT